jgi:hypothetical protein
MAVMLKLTLMGLIVGNSLKFTTLVRVSADTIRIVYEMRPCADILSGDPPGGIRMASGEHWFANGFDSTIRQVLIDNKANQQLKDADGETFQDILQVRNLSENGKPDDGAGRLGPRQRGRGEGEGEGQARIEEINGTSFFTGYTDAAKTQYPSQKPGCCHEEVLCRSFRLVALARSARAQLLKSAVCYTCLYCVTDRGTAPFKKIGYVKRDPIRFRHPSYQDACKNNSLLDDWPSIRLIFTVPDDNVFPDSARSAIRYLLPCPAIKCPTISHCIGMA